MVRIPPNERGPAAPAGRKSVSHGIPATFLLLIFLAAITGLAAPAESRQHATVAAGANHSLGVKADGTVAAWGYNCYGQSTVPAGLSGVREVSAGVFHNLALKSDGTVATWGSNLYGEGTVPS